LILNFLILDFLAELARLFLNFPRKPKPYLWGQIGFRGLGLVADYA